MSDFLRRRAFSLVELLVAISIILVLLALMGAAVSAARSSGAKQRTQATITAIDTILQRHFTSVESSRAGATGPNADRALALRKQVTADMPDSWEEVRHMKAHSQEFSSARQRGYVAFLDAVKPTNQFADAECLFMIVMQGGLADCLACATLDKARKGDKDNDGALEFWDEWDEPIRYVLWPAGFELPIGTKFFSRTAPFRGGRLVEEEEGGELPAGGTMRPLIFSGGPTKLATTSINPDKSYLAFGDACGDPWRLPDRTEEEKQVRKILLGLGGHDDPDTDKAPDHRGDNITNFDSEVKR